MKNKFADYDFGDIVDKESVYGNSWNIIDEKYYCVHFILRNGNVKTMNDDYGNPILFKSKYRARRAAEHELHRGYNDSYRAMQIAEVFPLELEFL